MQARLWQQKQAAAAEPPSDTASLAKGTGGVHDEATRRDGNGAEAEEQSDGEAASLPPVDAQPVTDLLNEVLLLRGLPHRTRVIDSTQGPEARHASSLPSHLFLASRPSPGLVTMLMMVPPGPHCGPRSQ